MIPKAKMCNRPSQVIAEKEGTAIFQKGNEPEEMSMPILWKPCACGNGYVGRSPGNTIWSEAKEIKQKGEL
jgi:hypothetical protein